MTLKDLKDDWHFVRYCHILAYGRGNNYRSNAETVKAARKLYKRDKDIIDDFNAFVCNWGGVRG